MCVCCIREAQYNATQHIIKRERTKPRRHAITCICPPISILHRAEGIDPTPRFRQFLTGSIRCLELIRFPSQPHLGQHALECPPGRPLAALGLCLGKEGLGFQAGVALHFINTLSFIITYSVLTSLFLMLMLIFYLLLISLL